MKLLLGLMIFAFLGWLAVRYAIMRVRRMRGEPVPADNGPRLITIVCIALIVIYTVLIVWRLHMEGLDALY